MIKITVDFETRSEANLKKIGAYEYSVHPTTRALCFSFKYQKSEKIVLLNYYEMEKPFRKLSEKVQNIWRSWILNPEIVFSAHNAFFEQCIYNNVLVKRLGWPAIPLQKWRCTAAKAASVAIPRNLGDAGAVMRTTIQKDYEGHRVMMKLCKPTAAWNKWKKANDDVNSGKRVSFKTQQFANKPEPTKFYEPNEVPEDFAMLYKYCKIDVWSEEKLDESLPDLTPKEQRLWFEDQKINLRGIQVDMPLVNKIASVMADEAKTMSNALDILTMGLVSSGNARAAILDFLTLEGIELPDLRAKTVDDFLNNGKATGDAAEILKIRRALSKSSTAKYHTFQRRAASDGRVRDLLLYHGASTGRWGGVGIQPQNFPRGIVKDIYEAIERIKECSIDDLKMLYGENLMPLFSSVLRGMFIATPGYELFVEDYSAIECRVLWWLAGHEDGLKLFREGRDPYKEMASKIYNKSILEITDDERQVGKAAVLGCGFQMGGKKFVTSAWDVYRAKVDKDMAKVAVSVYREVHYPVAELWEQYNNACIQAVNHPDNAFKVGPVIFFKGSRNRFLWVRLPSGRRLAYCDPNVVTEWTYVFEINGEQHYASNDNMYRECLRAGGKLVNSFQSEKLTYMAVNQKAKKVDCVIPKWTKERTYGGKIAENITQAVARDILAEAILRCSKRGFSVLMHSHDELVCEAPKGRFTSDDYKKIMEELPDWAQGLPLKSGGWSGDRYRKG